MSEHINSQTQTVVVVIPDGQISGSTINVKTDDNRLFAVTIPPGYEPGQNLVVEI